MPLPLDLYAEIAGPDGTKYRWDANQAPGSRLQNFSFRTKVGEGFSDSSGQLARRIDLDYPDLQLLNTITVVGADGSVAYEGRLEAMPRSLSDSHSVGVTLAGWMAHARDRKFAEIYVDRDLAAWEPMSRGRKIGLMSSSLTPFDPSQATDPTDSAAGVSTGWDGAWGSTYHPISEAWYDAGPLLTIGKIAYSWKIEAATVSAADPNWNWNVTVASDDKSTASQGTANLRAAGPSAGQLFTPTVNYRYALFQFLYGTSAGGADGQHVGIAWYKPAVYGTHGLTLRTGQTGEPDGVFAADVIRNIAKRYCPRLNTIGVRDTDYVIQHLAFKDPVDPYDAFLEVNKYHLWHLGVWEDRTLHFRRYDLTDYQWEIRIDDPGTALDLQGQSTDSLANGIQVTYTNLLTGKQDIITPDLDATLKDTSPENPYNLQGVQHWAEISLSTPTLPAQAAQIGRAALADQNRPKTPGSITVQGYIRDRQGNDQPVWKVRAGDTLTVSNYPNDRPRLIQETNYDDSTKTVTLSVDAPASTMDALFDRLSVAFTASNLTS